jgi:hypothetical protein
MCTDTAELMHAGECTDSGVIFDDDMARQSRGIGHDDVVAQRAVMADVRVCHQKIMVPDSRVPTTALGPSMDVYVFAKNVVVADCKEGFFAFEFQILWLKTDCSERIEMIVIADDRRTFDNYMRLEMASVSDSHSSAHAAVRPNRHIMTDLSLGTYNRSRMDHGC